MRRETAVFMGKIAQEDAPPVTRIAFALAAVMALTACVEPATMPPQAPPREATPDPVVAEGRRGSVTVQDFASVVARVEPVAENVCRTQTRGANCDFLIVVDRNPRAPANAFQSLDKTGRPVLTFTVALIADVYNEDELAFILGHEAAHHIEGHLARAQESAQMGGLLGAVIGVAIGADATTVQDATRLGAFVGARRFSKDHELEADRLGTVISYRAGYNPVKGAAYFTRIPDPGDSFLGSHPPNAQRIETVRRTLATL